MSVRLFIPIRVASPVRSLPILFLSVALLASTPVAAESDDEDFRITLYPGYGPGFEGTAVSAALVRQVPGELLEWNLSTTKTRLLGRVESNGYFRIERPEQMLPEIDDNFPAQCKPSGGWPEGFDSWHFFARAYESTVLEGGECGHLVNITGAAPHQQFLLAFPVNATKGNATLRLSRDVTAPGFGLGTVQNISHYGFYFETTTTDWAFASLMIRKTGGGDYVENPTAVPSLLQRFPVQGLDSATEYTFHIEFWDWSGNRARSNDVNMTTAPTPVYPAPEIISVVPSPNSTVASVPEISATFANPEGTISMANLFLDKKAVEPDLLQIGSDRVSYTPTDSLAPGRHVVNVEIFNSVGGKASKQWGFQVRGETSTPGLGFALLFVAAAVALALRWPQVVPHVAQREHARHLMGR